MGRGPLLVTSSASAAFLPSAWLSRSPLPPERTPGRHVRAQHTSGPRHMGLAQAADTDPAPTHGPVHPPRKGRVDEGTGAHARSRLGEPWPGVSRPPRAGPSAETPSSPCASPSHTRHPGHGHLCPTGSCLLECSRNTRPLGPETGAAGLPSLGSGLTPQEKTRASAGPQTRS